MKNSKIRRWSLDLLTLISVATSLTAGGLNAAAGSGYSLVFDTNQFAVKTLNVGNQTVTYRAYEGIVYVANPVDTNYQCMNIYVPVQYCEGKSVGSYNAN